MSAWRAVFRAEILRVLPLLPLVLVLHGLMIGVRCERGIDLSPRLAGLVESGTVVLAIGIVVTSLWMDSPERRQRFLATRPVKPLRHHSAKFAALFLLAGLPFVVVELVDLLAWGWSGSSVLLGTLQMLLIVLVGLLAAFPLVWLWRGKINAAIGTVLICLVAERAVWWPGKLHYSYTAFYNPPVALLIIGSIALLLAALIAIPGRFRHLLKTLLFLPATGLAAFVAVWICSSRPKPPERGDTVPLVQLSIHVYGRQDDDLHVKFPAPAPPGAVVAEWRLTRFVANGRDLPTWQGAPDAAVGWSHYGVDNPAMQKALRARFGDTVKLPEPEAMVNPWAQGRGDLKGVLDAEGRVDLDLTAQESLLGFEVVGELPLKAGASLRQGDLLWTLDLERNKDGNILHADLSLRTPYLWLGSFTPEADVAYRAFLLSGSGEIKQLGSWWQGPPGPRGYGSLRRFQTGSSFGEAVRKMDLASARLVIVRPVVLSRRSYSWKSPEPVDVGADPDDSYPKVPDPGPGAVLPWLEQHPGPPATATGEEVSSWLKELLHRIRLTPPPRNSEDPGFEAAIAAVATLVPAHPDRVHQALEDLPDSRNGAQNVCREAFMRSLQRDAVKRFPELMEDNFIRYQYFVRGWAADVIPYEVEQVRQGLNPTIEVLLADPQATGFSQEEWLNLFRVYPYGHVFQALNGKVVPKPLLEAEADRVLAAWAPPTQGRLSTQYHLLLNLGLARGRSDAPQWLAFCIQRWRATGENNTRGLGVTLATYFILPESANSDEAAIDWFMAKDPASFAFDAATGKYQLP